MAVVVLVGGLGCIRSVTGERVREGMGMSKRSRDAREIAWRP